MAPTNTLDMATLLKLLDEAGRPYLAKLDRIEEKLATHATKADLEKVRQEVTDLGNRVDAKLTTGYVSKDVYESRHSQLVGRDLQLDEAIRAERSERDKDMADIKELIRDTNAQLEASRRQVETRFQAVEANVERRLKDSSDAQLSNKDRAWIRAGQILSWIAIVVAAVSPFAAVAVAHIQFR